MDPAEVLAVEVRQYVGDDGLQTLVPRVIGKTAIAEQKKGPSGPRGTWDAERFMESATTTWELPNDQLAAVRRLLSFAEEKSDDCGWGTGKVHGSFSPKFSNVSPRSLFTVRADGYLFINFDWLNRTEKELQARELLAAELKAVPAFGRRIRAAEGYTAFPPAEWSPDVERFIAIIAKVTGT